ncbi:MAG: hypothetical protein EBS30_16275 [Planctomycetes bacterium]|nr:hypothetical protein [Planctomycetota bacterium]
MTHPITNQTSPTQTSRIQTSRLQHFQLTPFDPLPVEFNLSVGGYISRPNTETIQIHYQLTGDLNSVVIPLKANPPVRRDELWTTTCLELFIGAQESSPYWEFNLSPNGDWNIYKLSEYRSNLTPDLAYQNLSSTIRIGASQLELHLVCPIPADLMSSPKLDVAICAVIQFKQGPISYWALNHGGPEADFHRRDGFLLGL